MDIRKALNLYKIILIIGSEVKMMEKKTLSIIDKYGKEIKYEILYAFRLEETKKDYIIYTDNTIDNVGKLNIFASIYHLDDNTLENIETEEEWEAIENILQNIMEG